ncbi:MAG: glycosyl hydrolase, partial [Myxococcales bacterium]|nr:glycosyl hydrolase [Myxococcales bacterium]
PPPVAATGGSVGEAGSGGSEAGVGGSEAGHGGSTAGFGGSEVGGSGGSSDAGQGGTGGSGQDGNGKGPKYPDCVCRADVDNFCLYPKDTPGCPMLQGGYCDPSTGVIQWELGYFEFQGACGKCGNGVCEVHESCTVCSKDCGGCGGSCGNGVCDPGESTGNCLKDCPAPPLQEPDRLLGIHFWDGDVPKVLGTGLYYDVEAFDSQVPPDTVVAWLKEREASGARGIIRVDYKWGYSVPKNDGEQAEYNGRLVAIAKAIAAAGLKTHHFIVGNETNLPEEGGATPQQAGQAFASAKLAIDTAGPYPYPMIVMPSAPSTAAQFGGGDGSYLRDELMAAVQAGVKPQAIAIHAYENPDSNGSADLFMATVNYQAKAILDAGLAGVPLFITEYNMAMLDSSWHAKGAAFISNSAKRLDAWNKGGEGNPSPGKLFVVSTCYFIWPDDPLWPLHSLQKHPPLRDAFYAAWGLYPSGKAF